MSERFDSSRRREGAKEDAEEKTCLDFLRVFLSVSAPPR